MRGGGEGSRGAAGEGRPALWGGAKEEAAAAYGEALSRAPADWSRRPRAVESLLNSLWGAGKSEACARAASSEVPRMPVSPSRANAAAIGLSCALEVPKGSPLRQDALSCLSGEVEQAIAWATSSPKRLVIAADDVSGFFETLHSAREDAKDHKEAIEVARRWSSYLDAEAVARRRRSSGRCSTRTGSLAYLGLGARRSRRFRCWSSRRRTSPTTTTRPRASRLPTGDEKTTRSARRQRARPGEGLRSSPIRVLQNRADILRDQGNKSAARAALEEALHTFDALPAGQRDPRIRERVQKQLEAN